MKSWRLTLAILFVLFCQDGRAAQEPNSDDLRKTVSALKNDVDSLKDKQEQIVNELRELRKMIGGSVVEAPPTVKPPPTLPVTGELFRGDKTAPVVIIEYGDFECQYCQNFLHETYPKIADSYITTGKVKYFYRDLAIQAHAIPAARAARCAGEQGKLWQMHDNLFANQNALTETDISNRAASIGIDSTKLSECLSSVRYTEDIQKSTAEAQKMGIVGTPTFLFGIVEPNSDVVRIKHTFVGVYPFEFFKSEIDDLLASKEVQVGSR
jgi:protein-disulfide isomerase